LGGFGELRIAKSKSIQQHRKLSKIIWATSSSTPPTIKELNDTIELAKSMEKELEALIRIKDDKGSMEGVDDGSMLRLSRFLEENRVDLVSQEPFSLRAANDIMSKLGAQLEPFRVVTNETSPWEEKSAAVRLANKMQKSRRNKQWRKRKRRIAEMLVKEREQFDQADQEADEWRAREIAKDIAKGKVSKSSTCDSFEAPQDEASIVENDATLEDMEDLAAVTAALGLAVTEVDFINGKCLSKSL